MLVGVWEVRAGAGEDAGFWAELELGGRSLTRLKLDGPQLVADLLRPHVPLAVHNPIPHDRFLNCMTRR